MRTSALIRLYSNKIGFSSRDESVKPMAVSKLIYFVMQWHIIVVMFSGTQLCLVVKAHFMAHYIIVL